MSRRSTYLLGAAISVVASVTVPQTVLAQDSADQAASSAAPAGEGAIVVLGTRRADRTVTDSASPVDVIGAQDLVGQPSADMVDAVKNVVPSFFVGQNTISDASTFVRSASLRGLPGDQVLVMINGKRFNRSSLVQVYAGGDTALSFGSQGPDISSIPSLAIANLQVLREGATAQYGSDAIAGVLNFQLRSKPGFEMQARYGQYFDNGGDGQSYQIAGNYGVDLGSRGFINLTGEYNDNKQTSRGVQVPSAVYFDDKNPTLTDRLPNYPDPVQNWGSSPSHGYKLMLNAAYDAADWAQLYVFGNYANSKGDQSFQYRPVSDWEMERDNGTDIATGGGSANSVFRHPIYLTPCPDGNATCPEGGFVKDGNVYNFSTLYPAGFTPRFVGETTEIYGTVGAKGEIDQLTWDLSGTWARHKLDLSMYSSLAPSYGPSSQTEFEFGQLSQTETNANLDLTYPLEVGLASPLTLSAGAEYRNETYEATEGDPQSYGVGPYGVQALYVETAPGVFAYDSAVTMFSGASGYAGTSPQAAGKYSQNSYGGYVGIEGDLTENLSFGAAGRYEHYDTFGDATVGKVNAIYHLSPEFAIRASYGTGFHAPSPGQNNVQVLTTAFIGGNQVQTGTYPVTSAAAQYFGAKSLSPEKATNFGIGFVIEPGNGFTLTADAYSIKVKNRIGLSQSFDVTADDVAAEPILAAVGAGGAVQYFTNGFDTKTVGVDVVASYRTYLAGGALNFTLAYNYNRSRVTDYDPNVVGKTQLIDIQYLAPNHRANLSANWQLGDFTFNVRESYYGEWRNSNDYPIREGNLADGAIIDGQHFGEKFLTDLDVSYRFMDRYTLTVGANNVFNTYPDKIMATVNNPIYTATGSLANGSVYPRSGGPFGINGGMWYVRLGVKY
ncbi:MAG: TonB-dependent receptor plug domain-containing protein [Tsuneonella suprasediminis]|uniref:TonB-dependent receptor n=1 Tax=Tsuneonella suprasediminis TaxID=2306996 RepID=A0A419R5U7_9SPHN|nr:TonB-dependent receptor [Tsuneonella suprasediminis]RJX71266.1 TonB-dependent receptor [Tsuneonella suprasediminis]UBS34525.1 TonB-dependent receptor [Altererythrobacter sp. N1]